MSSSNSPCAACKCLRRKCTLECVFAPYFPPENPQKFTNVHKVFGASNVAKILTDLSPQDREDAVNSLAYEAEYRIRDPVYGCVGLVSILQHKLKQVHVDLENAKKELAAFIGPTAMLPMINPHQMGLMQQQQQHSNYAAYHQQMMVAAGGQYNNMMGGGGSGIVIQEPQQIIEAQHHQMAAAAAREQQQEMMRQYEQQQHQLQQQQNEHMIGFNNGGYDDDPGEGGGAVVTATGFNQMQQQGMQQQQPSLALGGAYELMQPYQGQGQGQAQHFQIQAQELMMQQQVEHNGVNVQDHNQQQLVQQHHRENSEEGRSNICP